VADALVSVASVVSVAIDIGYQRQELALTWCLFLGGWCVLHGIGEYKEYNIINKEMAA
jgi:hypothetical protein